MEIKLKDLNDFNENLKVISAALNQTDEIQTSIHNILYDEVNKYYSTVLGRLKLENVIKILKLVQQDHSWEPVKYSELQFRFNCTIGYLYLKELKSDSSYKLSLFNIFKLIINQ